MTEKIYQLWELPFEKPSVLYNALKFVDQNGLLKLVDQTEKYPRASLLPLVDLAHQAGVVKMEAAFIPTKGTATFVDLKTFPGEFNEFVSKVEQQQLQITKSDVMRVLKRNQVKRKTLKQYLLNLVTNNRWLHIVAMNATIYLLPVVEKFCSTPEQYFKVVSKTLFRPSQYREEICGLLRLLQTNPPRNVLEIGTNRGGTFYLFARFAHPQAILATVDLRLQHPKLLASFGRKQQKIVLIEGDSSQSDVIHQIKQTFPQGIDLLLIDGDHSYEGVQRDFQNYAPLVNPGGLIVFHDIIQDNEIRYGVITGGWAGGVPKFWQEHKPNYETKEFVKNYEQDGLGIGVLMMPASDQSDLHSNRP